VDVAQGVHDALEWNASQRPAAESELGLGLAIDYSLFTVSRYREEAARSGFGVEALRWTLATSGRTILFSSLTVAAALASLTIFPQNFLFSMGLAGAVVALVAATLALVVLPALLAVLGPRVNALAPTWLRRAADRDARPAETGFWYRLSRFVIARPGRIALLTAAALIALGVPFASIKFLPANASMLPSRASSYRVDAALRTEFPPGRTAPLEVVVPIRDDGQEDLRGKVAESNTDSRHGWLP